MQIARQNGKLRGRQSRLKPAQDREIRRMHDSGDYNVAEIAALFSVSRPTVYRSLDRTAELPRFPPAPGAYLMTPSTTSCSPATSNNSDGPGPSPQEHLVAPLGLPWLDRERRRAWGWHPESGVKVTGAVPRLHG